MRWLQPALKPHEDPGKKNVPEPYRNFISLLRVRSPLMRGRYISKQETASKTAMSEVRKIREPTLGLEFPGEDDGHLKTPEDATTVATDGQDVATDVATMVATNEPGRAVLAARHRAGQRPSLPYPDGTPTLVPAMRTVRKNPYSQ